MYTAIKTINIIGHDICYRKHRETPPRAAGEGEGTVSCTVSNKTICLCEFKRWHRTLIDWIGSSSIDNRQTRTIIVCDKRKRLELEPLMIGTRAASANFRCYQRRRCKWQRKCQWTTTATGCNLDIFYTCDYYLINPQLPATKRRLSVIIAEPNDSRRDVFHWIIDTWSGKCCWLQEEEKWIDHFFRLRIFKAGFGIFNTE